jgi:NAD(P)-dependent dehydrogenase (short-subunit alcohol dehydrogenase family)
MPITPDSRVLITAGAGGIGRAMGEAFTAAGARVWVTDIDGDALAACPADWRKTTLDVTDGPAMAAMFAGIEAEWGGLDTLCANAGSAGPTALIEDVELDDWRRCVSVNIEMAPSSQPNMPPQ